MPLGRQFILNWYYSSAYIALRVIDPAPVLPSREHCSRVMLGPAVNRQPGFCRGTRRAKQRREEHPVGCLPGSAAGWLAAGWLAGWLAAAAADPWRAGWLLAA